MIIPHNLPAASIATRRNSQAGDLLVIKIKVKLIMTKGWYTFKIVTIRTHDEIMMIIKEVMVGTRAGHPQVISAISTTHQPFLLNNIVPPLLFIIIIILIIIIVIIIIIIIFIIINLRSSLPSPPPTSPSFSATFSSPSQAPYSHHHYHLQNRRVIINLFKHIVQIIFKANYDKNDGRPHHFHNSTTLSSYFYRASSSNHDNRKDGLSGVRTFR